MKKEIMSFGAIVTVFLLISVGIAVPKAHSQPLMDAIHKVEEIESGFNDQKISELVPNPEPNGLIDLLRQLIELIIQFIQNLIDIIFDLLGIVELIQYLINLIMILVDAIVNLINTILDIFTPNAFKVAKNM
ncbi:MAG: hypothetical protein R6U21_07510 [Thermoplasmatota archaeon]